MIDKKTPLTVGTFGSCMWIPQDETELHIVKSANYFSELVSYTVAFPQLSNACPPKIALASIAEAARRTYNQIMDSIALAAFTRRLYGLSELPQVDDGISLKEFSYDNEVQ